jgi:hypothetical protein
LQMQRIILVVMLRLRLILNINKITWPAGRFKCPRGPL